MFCDDHTPKTLDRFHRPSPPQCSNTFGELIFMLAWIPLTLICQIPCVPWDVIQQSMATAVRLDTQRGKHIRGEMPISVYRLQGPEARQTPLFYFHYRDRTVSFYIICGLHSIYRLCLATRSSPHSTLAAL